MLVRNDSQEAFATKRAREASEGRTRISIDDIVNPEPKKVKTKKNPKPKATYQPIEPLTAKKLLDETKVSVSLGQLINVSPAIRTEIKQLSHPPRKPKNQKNSLNVEGGSPRVKVDVMGKKTLAILDGGSSANIISLKFAKELGIRELKKSNQSFTFANGQTEKALGLVTNLPVTISETEIVIEAVVFDHEKYNLLLSRQTMERF